MHLFETHVAAGAVPLMYTRRAPQGRPQRAGTDRGDVVVDGQLVSESLEELTRDVDVDARRGRKATESTLGPRGRGSQEEDRAKGEGADPSEIGPIVRAALCDRAANAGMSAHHARDYTEDHEKNTGTRRDGLPERTHGPTLDPLYEARSSSQASCFWCSRSPLVGRGSARQEANPMPCLRATSRATLAAPSAVPTRRTRRSRRSESSA